MSVDDNISNELQEISTIVATINKTNVFVLPDNYFTHFQEQLMHIVHAPAHSTSDELLSVAPFLASLQKTNPFQLPDQYAIQIDVAKVIETKPMALEHPKHTIFTFYNQHKSILRIAASILLLVAATTWIYISLQRNNANQKTTEWSQISEQEFNEFIITETDDLPILSTEKEDIADNLFNIESGVNTLKEEELQFFLAEIPEYKTEKIN
jgi:hypothetical protein